MRPTDVRELGEIASIAITSADYIELIECKAFRRMVQLLYGTVDGLYRDLIRPGINNEQMHFLRGRISAMEEILGINNMLASESHYGSMAAKSEDGPITDGDDAFRTVVENLNRGNNDV